MVIAAVRYASNRDNWTSYRLAEVLNEYPSLGMVRVRIIETGEVRHVHQRSIALRATVSGGAQ